MELLQLAAERYSIRKFKTDKVPQEIVEKILKAGHLAPTAVNFQPQKILVVTSEDGLAKFRKCTKSHFNAPLAFIVGYDKNTCWRRPFDDKASGDIDAAIVGTHMMLEAYSLGIGSTWVMAFDPEAVMREFDLPDTFVPTVVFPMGYPADDAVPAPRHTQFRDEKEIVEYR